MINTALLKEQLNRFRGLSALLFAYYALTIALPIYAGNSINLLLSLIDLENDQIVLSVFLAPLVAVVILFNFQNQVKSVTAMLSYPLTKNQILATNALAGMILLVLPLLALCVITFIPIHGYYHDLFFSARITRTPRFPVNQHFGAFLNSILAISRFFIITALSFLFHLILYMLAAMLSGNTIITLPLCFVLPFLPIGIAILARVICQFYVFGFYARANSHFYLASMHPYLWDRDRGMLFQVILYFVTTFAIATCCVFASNKRKQEWASDSVVFPYVKNVLVFILSVCGLFLIGVIFFEMFSSLSAIYVGFAVGFFIAYCIAQMIAEKTFNIINKMKDFVKFGAIAVGFLLVIIVATESDIFGYERYVPHFADIEGIQMGDLRIFRDRDRLTNTALNELLVRDTEIINETIALHQAIISERETLRRFEIERRRDHSLVSRRLDILYKLNNGNVIVRSYRLSESFMNDHDVHGLIARSRLSISLLQNSPDLIDRIQLRVFGYDSTESAFSITEHEHISEFVDALMKDLVPLKQGITYTSNYIRIRIISESVISDSMAAPLLFEIAYDDDSHVFKWLFEKPP